MSDDAPPHHAASSPADPRIWPSTPPVAGVSLDIGGTKIAAAACDSSAALTGPVRSTPTPATEGSAAVISAATDLVRSVRPEGAAFLAVSSAGVIDPITGVVLSATEWIVDWASTEVRGSLSKATALSTTVINDGHAFAIGEQTFGVGVDAASLLLVAVGTGIGGSFVVNGSPQLGAHAFGGHFGHVAVPQAHGIQCPCGAYGHAEAVGGGQGIVRTYQRARKDAGGEEDPTKHRGDVNSVEQVAQRVLTDPAAMHAIELGASAVGTLIGSLINALDPAMAVVTGGVARIGDVWWSKVIEEARATAIPTGPLTPIRLSSAGPEMALRGAVRYAIERMTA